MAKIDTYQRRAKSLLKSAQTKFNKIGKSKYVRSKKVWAAALAVVGVLVFWVLPTFLAKAPGQLGYGIKRVEEAVITGLAPSASLRDALTLNFADERVAESVYVATQANQTRRSGDEAKAAATINDLLASYEEVYDARTAGLNQHLTKDNKPAKGELLSAQKNAVGTYDELQLLRLQAPAASQISVLVSIDDTQKHLAALSDALDARPLSPGDLAELAKLIPIGVVTQAQVDQLTAIKSSRELHARLVTMVNGGQLPSDITYVLDQDLIKQVDASRATSFAAVSEFEQMQRISAVIAASRPTKEQQHSVQAFVAAYQPGKAIPGDDTEQYVTPIVYGIALSGRLLNDLSSLKSLPLSSDNQAILNSWKKVIDPPNLTDIYQRLMTGAQSDPQLTLRNLIRMQQELVDAQKAQVSYLVMPPGWSNGQLSTLNREMGIEIAKTNYIASKPDVNQELARVLSVQNQLQATLLAYKQSSDKMIAELQAKINTSTGAPEQTTTLKDQLMTLVQTQTTTINDLQTQIIAITDAHTKLDSKIDTLRQDQLTSLYELEIRATTAAQAITSNLKDELTTKLTRIESTSQRLIDGLQGKIDGLTSDHEQLKNQLNGEISTIKTNYQELKNEVKTQLDAGVATAANLQASLTETQSNLDSLQTKLTDLGADTTALSTLVGQVKTDAEEGLNSLQSQVDVVKLDQQATQSAVNSLQAITQTSHTLVTGLTDRANGLDASQNTLRSQLTSSIATISNDQEQFAAYVQAQIDAGAATTADLQELLQSAQTNLTQQAGQLGSLGTSVGALTALVDRVKVTSESQVADLQGQIDGLHINQQTVEASLGSLRDQQTNDVAELNAQVASLSVLQTEAAATINVLSQQASTAHGQISSLSSDFSVLESTLNNLQQTQNTLLATVTEQQTSLDNLVAQTQSALDTLTQQQTQLATSVNNVAADVSTLGQTLTTVQTASSATQAQLDTLLASPPWAIPQGTYVTQSEFDALTTQINNQFAQKSSQLDAQFQAYQTQLNTTVSQLNAEVQSLSSAVTNTANTQSQQGNQITTLNSQIQTLQAQVQQLLSATPAPGGL